MSELNKKEDKILNIFKSRLLQTNKRSLVFYNSFKENSYSIDLIKACSSTICSNKGFNFVKKNYEFKIAESLDNKKDNNKLLKNQFSSIYKKNNLIIQEKNIHSLFVGSYFIEGILDNNKSNVFRAPLILYRADISIKGNVIEIKNINYDEPQLNNSILLLMAAKNNLNWEFSEVDEHFFDNGLEYVLSLIKKTGFFIKNNHLEEFNINNLKEATQFTKEELYNYFTNVIKVNRNELILNNYISFGLYDIASSAILSAYNKIEEDDRVDFIDEIITNNIDPALEADVEWNEKEIVQISDLDVTQKTAIANSLSRSQFIWGPPGTGKSETIVNLLANIIFNNNRALFITEKKVASDVVYDRMKDLKDFCLMLFNKSEGVQFHQQVKKIHNAIELRAQTRLNNYNNKNIFINYGDKIDSSINLAKRYKKHFTSQSGRIYLKIIQYLKNDINNYTFDENIILNSISYSSFEKLQELNEYDINQKYNSLFNVFKTLDIKTMYKKNIFSQIYLDDNKRKIFFYNLFIKNKYKTKLPLFSKNKFQNFLNDKINQTNYNNLCFLVKSINNVTYDNIIEILYALALNNNNQINIYDYDYLCAVYINDHKIKYQSILKDANKWIELIKKDSSQRYLNDVKWIYNKHIDNVVDKLFESKKREYEGIKYSKLFKSLGNAINSRKQIRLTTYFKNYMELLKILFPIIITNPNNASNQNFLKLNEKEFDFVIFDEASQIFVEKCIPALFRAKKYIIVGDDKQLPPTNFFSDKLEGDEEELENQLEDIDKLNLAKAESLIDFANSRYPKSMLQYHYRSNYTELINFSNSRYYESKLQVVNKNQKSFLPIEIISAEGNFENGVNVEEANIIVKLILQLLKDPDYEGKTIGVITFNADQKKLIDSLIDKAAINSVKLQNLLNLEKGNELFVKNIENVQGDERDVIIFSIAFAPKKDGKFINNYGPLNLEGGQRRLNVAITRAKHKMIIVKSIHSRTMNPNKQGAIDLRDFLSFAELLQNRETIKDANALIFKNNYNDNQNNELKQFDSEFEVEVFNEIDKLITPYKDRYELRNQTDACGYKIDITILDKQKEEYALAIECDGYTYHSSDFDRKRDIDRQYYLEKRGWKFERILSTHWWSSDKKYKEQFLKNVLKAIKEI
ncbi:hypothetical protein SGLAD_v1c06070 [Spiroplasma gladiatoris]|uniref:RAP domain-containing protein n=1 Tax=Spiroplasma gladiatoris TaxID=2143 RepID=A0A4P7AJG4_9MOLU|nr:AAA domain-containing protein [Spiroplasma gladiatoris]QBQ07806.1 hypothetical protein SGLAD_v1c06070 [Spiroplasma gladiatoris]